MGLLAFAVTLLAGLYAMREQAVVVEEPAWGDLDVDVIVDPVREVIVDDDAGSGSVEDGEVTRMSIYRKLGRKGDVDGLLKSLSGVNGRMRLDAVQAFVSEFVHVDAESAIAWVLGQDMFGHDQLLEEMATALCVNGDYGSVLLAIEEGYLDRSTVQRFASRVGLKRGGSLADGLAFSKAVLGDTEIGCGYLMGVFEAYGLRADGVRSEDIMRIDNAALQEAAVKGFVVAAQKKRNFAFSASVLDVLPIDSINRDRVESFGDERLAMDALNGVVPASPNQVDIARTFLAYLNLNDNPEKSLEYALSIVSTRERKIVLDRIEAFAAKSR